MAEYINRDTLLSKKHGCNRKDCSNCDFFTGNDSWCEGELFIVDVLNAPAADVVEVVRCKDCFNRTKSGMCIQWSRYEKIVNTPDYAFCSWGVKRNG